MSFWVAGAAVASAVIGAASSQKASKDAAKGQAKGLAASQAMSNQAIGQAKDYFNIGQRSSQAGFQSAMDFFKNAQPAKYEPMIQGNVAAQKVIGQGAQQANNAILGLPVDMSFANQQTAIQPNYSAIQSAQLPVLGGDQAGSPSPSEMLGAPDPAKDPNTEKRKWTADMGKALKPDELLKNPLGGLGFGNKITDRFNVERAPQKLKEDFKKHNNSIKKTLKKIF